MFLSLTAHNLLLVLLISLALTCHSWGASVNVTVDDENGNENTKALPSYSPSSSWVQGASCSGCLAKPDSSQAFDGTWHDATFDPNGDAFNIEINFEGSAIYAYFILANQVQYAATFTNLSFSLDGTNVGTFVHNPSTSTDYEYNVVGYANGDIENAAHTFVISSSGTNNSLILFDRLVYTTDDTTTRSPILTTASSLSSSSQSLLTSSSSQSSTSTVSTESSVTTTTTPTSALPTSVGPGQNTASQNSLSLSLLSVPTTTDSSNPLSSGEDQNRSNESVISQRGTIIGGCVGGGLAALIGFAAILVYLRRRKDAQKIPLPMTRQSIDGTETRHPARRITSKFSSLGSATSLAVIHPSSRANASDVDSSAVAAPYLDEDARDPFRKDGGIDLVRTPELGRSPSVVSPIPSDRTLPNPWSPETGGGERGEEHVPVLMDQIAILRAQIHQLQTHHGDSDESWPGSSPPPDYCRNPGLQPH